MPSPKQWPRERTGEQVSNKFSATTMWNTSAQPPVEPVLLIRRDELTVRSSELELKTKTTTTSSPPTRQASWRGRKGKQKVSNKRPSVSVRLSVCLSVCVMGTG